VELKATRYSVDDAGIATVELNRPHRHNAWTARMHAEYRWIMTQLDADPSVRVAVLTGAGDAFCVGGDAKALSDLVDAGGYESGLPVDATNPGYGVRTEFDSDIAWQLGLRLPLICAVNGSCAGVGMALAAFSDLRFAVAGAKVTTATAQLALPAELGLSWILPRILGLTNAADVLLSGRVLLAEELAGMGFFNRVFSADEFSAGVHDYALRLAQLSPEALTTTKRQLYEDILHSDPAASVERSKLLIGELMALPDYAEGIRALIDKRKPEFGR
jgi:enoyl-CoA hydratase/carnithine racemase